MYDFLIFRIYFFSIIKEYNFLRKSQYLTLLSIKNLQKERLYKILKFAVDNIPYYHEIAKRKKIKIDKENVFEEIKKFPILTKDIIRRNWKNLHANLKDVKYFINTSGGTTGEPINIIQDFSYFVKGYASTLVFNEYGGYFPGKKLIKIWGDEKEIITNSKGIIKYLISKVIKNTEFQNSFKMSNYIMKMYIDQIEKIKPKVIIAYVQSIHEIAKFLNKKKKKLRHSFSLITSAGDLSKKLRDYLTDVLNCKIYNRYGSRELGLIAMSCEKCEKLHINMLQKYLEILNSNLLACKEHERGEVIITDLLNFSMPLIRYRIGDTASINYETCICGRNLIQLDNVYGRIIDIFKNENGDLIYGDFFTHLFYFKQDIKQFQVVQNKVNEIKISISTNSGNPLKKDIEEDIKRNIMIVMGDRCNIIIEYVSYINPTRSGKYIYTISNIK